MDTNTKMCNNKSMATEGEEHFSVSKENEEIDILKQLDQQLEEVKSITKNFL